MHIITRKRLVEFSEVHPDASDPLDAWYRVAKRAAWAKFSEVRAVYPHADRVGTCVVFNVGGNKYRLIVLVAYATRPQPGERPFQGTIYVLHVLTHKEYDAGKWKADCGC